MTPLQLISRWLPVLLWMALIFGGSTDALAAHRTSGCVEPLLRWLSAGHLSEPQIATLHFFIRKAGHLTEYGILALLLWRALPPFIGWNRRKAALTAFLAAAYAASDEWHQSFVPSRGASVEDVLLDTTGALFALLLIWLWVLWRRFHPQPRRGGRIQPKA